MPSNAILTSFYIKKAGTKLVKRVLLCTKLSESMALMAKTCGLWGPPPRFRRVLTSGRSSLLETSKGFHHAEPLFQASEPQFHVEHFESYRLEKSDFLLLTFYVKFPLKCGLVPCISDTQSYPTIYSSL